MREKTIRLLAWALAGAVASPAAAEEYIIVNGLPCGALCRIWMGVKLPAETAPQTPEEPTPPPHVERRERAARQDAHERLERAPAKPAKVAHAPHPQAVAKTAATHRIVATAPTITPPAPVAQPSPGVAAAATEPVVAHPSPTAIASPEPAAPAATPTANVAAAPTEVAQPSPTAIASPEPAAPSATPTPSALIETPQPTPSAVASAPASPQVASLTPGGQPLQGRLIAIVMTKLDVQGVSDLHDKSIVLAGDMKLSDERLKAAFETAGADRATFKQGDVKDADEVESGAFAAAILAVVSPEVARVFPEIPGYRLLRVEVSP